MYRYQIITLVDITRSRASRNDPDRLKVGQQNNFDTLIQIIGLRANVFIVEDPIVESGRLPLPFQGKSKYWTFTFEVEHEHIFEKDCDPVRLLVMDLNGVPIITGLDDDANIWPSVFKTNVTDFNTVVKKCK